MLRKGLFSLLLLLGMLSGQVSYAEAVKAPVARNDLQKVIEGVNDLIGMMRGEVVEKLGAPCEKVERVYFYHDRSLMIMFNDKYVVSGLSYSNHALSQFKFPEVLNVLGKPDKQTVEGDSLCLRYKKDKYHRMQLIYRDSRLTEINIIALHGDMDEE